ncbi:MULTISPECIES: hypothetical protein [unclassified Pseudomonas]|uniref:hypothetical protein n=1 Tax=unclassified Pseudomonas TaxID=196821 RepID=UPI000A1ED964|nr:MULTISPECIES: hypothetical protein [unclassified Pseudomonas]
MKSWRSLGFWGKVWALVWLAFLVLTASESGASWMGEGSPGRKRVFSPGFLVLCVFVAVVELVLLNHFYGAQPV